MALGGEVYHEIGVEFLHKAVHKLGIADVAFYELHIGKFYLIFDGKQVACICQRVENQDLGLRAVYFQKIFYEIGAYESGSSGHEIFHLLRLDCVKLLNANLILFGGEAKQNRLKLQKTTPGRRHADPGCHLFASGGPLCSGLVGLHPD